jgi:hypothetical protein
MGFLKVTYNLVSKQYYSTVEASKELAHMVVRLRLILFSKETGAF